MNRAGITSSKARYVYQFGPRLMIGQVPVGASEVFTNTGGHFVWYDTSRYVEVAGSGTNPDSGTFIAGWAECGAFTASSTDGSSRVDVDVSPLSVYLIPADAAVTEAIRGKSCDLVVTSNVQSADVGETNEDYIIVLDVDITNQEVLVRIDEAMLYRTDIA